MGAVTFAKLVLALSLLKWSNATVFVTSSLKEEWHSLCLLYQNQEFPNVQENFEHQYAQKNLVQQYEQKDQDQHTYRKNSDYQCDHENKSTCHANEFMADCSCRHLKKVPENLSSSMTALYLFKNYLTEIPGMSLARYYNLKCLDISENYLKILTNESFQNLSKLIYLDLSNNKLVMKETSRPLFDQPDVETGFLVPLERLGALDIGRNEQRCLDDLIPVLSHISMSTVTFLGLQNVINPYMPEVVVSTKFVRSLPRNLRNLVFSSNSVEYFQDDVIDNLPQTLTQLDISDNRFTFGNYLRNFSKLENLRVLKLNGGLIAFDLPDKFPPDACPRLYQRRSPSYEFVQPNEALILQIPPNLKRLDIQYAGWSYTLTNFTIDSNNSLTHLNLNGNNFPRLKGPMRGFENLTHLSLVNSNVHYISTHFFDSFPSLLELNLSTNSFGYYVFNKTKPIFKSLNNLKVLDLSFVDIRAIKPNVFQGLDSLETLLLHRNPIYYFNVEISHMKNLAFINFSFSEISGLSVPVMETLDTIIKQRKYGLTLDFSESPVHCFCENLPFLRWLSTSNITLTTNKRNKCVFKDTSELYLPGDFTTWYHVYERECRSNHELFIAIFVATFAMIFIIVGVILYRFRWKLRYLYYSAYISVKGMDKQVGTSDQFDFDVFVSYVSDDHDFVVKTLYPKLESLGLKVHVHCLHFVSGEYISSNIVNAIHTSRHTLVVLTRNLLDSVWCKFELQMANMEHVHTGRSVLVFLLMENISKKELGTELLYHIQSSTYIKYPETEQHVDDRDMELFWTKLASDLRS